MSRVKMIVMMLRVIVIVLISMNVQTIPIGKVREFQPGN